MLKKVKTNEGIQYQKLSKEEMEAKGILGRLIGPCADFRSATRNGRKYSEQLWENVFNNPIMQEKIKNGCCFGELGHPADRTEVDMEKIAICLREPPLKGEDGKLYGCFDILNTPNGRILKTLCDYGTKIGISSRGQGDLITGLDGEEEVDPDTYDCECFDAVLIPAVESARLQYVNESLDTNRINMRKALNESLQNASEEDKKVMQETLADLNISLNEDTNVDEIDEEEYKKEGLEFAEKIRKEFDAEKAKEVFYNDYEFDKHAPDDEVEQAIYDALKEKMEEVQESLNEEKEEEVPEEAAEEVEETEVVEEQPAEEPVEEAPVEEPQPEAEEVKFTAEEVKEVAKEVAEEVAEEAEAEVEPEVIEDKVEEKVEAAVEEKAEEEAPIEAEAEVEVEETKEELPEEEPVEEAEEAEEQEIEEECNNESCADKNDDAKEVVEESAAAVDDGDAALVKNLQEALKLKATLENDVRELQEKLAVSDTKVNELTEETKRQKQAIARLATLSKTNKGLQENVSTLEESLKEKDAVISEQKLRIARLVKSQKERVSESLSLNESVEAKDNEVKSLNENLVKVNEELTALKEAKEKAENSVTELTENLNKATSLKEAYKNLANKAVNKYIEIKALTLGLTSKDIKRKLGESYSLEDVDAVCEELKAYQLNVSKLPFNVEGKIGVRVNESTSRSLTKKPVDDFEDDDVDETLIKLAKLK